MNLAEFPITSLSNRVDPATKTLEFSDTIFDAATGLPIHRELTVSGSDKYGLPTATDDDVIVALIQLTRLKNNFRDRRVLFTRSELIRILGWSQAGSAYKRLELSLRRWVGVTLYYQRSWRNHGEGTWEDHYFHILESVSLYGDFKRRQQRAQGKERLQQSEFLWDEIVFQSFRDGYVKALDMEVYFHRLRSAISRRLYRFLDKRFHGKSTLTFDLAKLAFDKVGISRRSPLSRAKQLLDRAIGELEEVGFLRPTSRQERYQSPRRGVWFVTFYKAIDRSRPPEPLKDVSEAQVADYWRGLDPEAQRALEAQALEEVDPRILESYQKMTIPSFKAATLSQIRDDYIRKILGTGPRA